KSAVGLTARQMGAVAIGCGSLAGAILVAGVRALFPDLIPPVGLLSGPAGLAAGVAFYLGFATPRWLQRSWSEPEFRSFVESADRLASEPDLPAVLRGLQSAASQALGLQTVFVGYWNEPDNCLEYPFSGLSADQLDTLGPGLSIE